MICPSCKNQLIILEFNKVEIDYCTECSGIWLDSGELELLSGKSHHEGIIENFHITDSGTEKKRKCPLCNKRMNKYFYGNDKELLVDICKKEHGIWFDKNELSLILSKLDKSVSNEISNFLNDIFNFQNK